MAIAPKLGGIDTSRSKANTTDARLNALVPSLSSDLSPVYIYTPAGVVELNGSGSTVSDYGWTCPDGVTSVQVECYGAGGGGGGGSNGVGGGGGGGGEYACETAYPVVPGDTYSYYVGGNQQAGNAPVSGTAVGDALLPGANGSDTHFDFRGKGITGGVLANGGEGGDQGGVGTGGRGGTGSSNTIHFDGGNGGTSSAGVMSDNPALSISIPNTQLWWRMDDATTGSIFARDYTEYSRPSANRVINSGAIVTPTTEIATPKQVPYGAATTWNGKAVSGETQGNCWKWDHGSSSGYIGGLLAPSFGLSNETTLTVSCWIKGLSTATSATDWGDSTAGAKMLIGNKNLSVVNDHGFNLLINCTDGTVAFGAVNSSGSTTSITSAGPSANDGNWHMVSAVFQTGSNNLKIYVDGVNTASGTAAISSIAAGTQRMQIGFNNAELNRSFKGYMSNVWISTSAAPSSYFSVAFGSSPATGGSGGGASGGSAGAGNAGGGAAGAVGGAAGASAAASNPGINNGSCAGGAGGNASANGSNADLVGPPTGGAGGGAGANASTTATLTQYLSCNMSGSYTGYDAQGMAGGQLYTVSADPQADITSPWYSTSAQRDSSSYTGGRADSPFQGSMFSILTFPSFAAINGSPSGQAFKLNDAHWTIDGMYLELTVNTPNAANMAVAPWYANTVLSSLPSDHTSMVALGMGPIAEYVYIPDGVAGRQVTIDLFDAGLSSSFVSKALNNGFGGSGVGLLLGQLHGSSAADPITTTAFGAWNDDEAEDWYCAFTGADDNPAITAQLIVKYHATATTPAHGGQGSPGYIVITFINPQGTPVATVLPSATTDASNNAFGAGFTADSANYNVWQPGSNPRVLETYHVISGYSNSWTRLDSTSDLRYRLLPGGLVHIIGRLLCPATFSATFSQVAILPAGYRPVRTQPVYMMGNNDPNGNAAPVTGRVATNGSVEVVGTMNINQALQINAVFPLV